MKVTRENQSIARDELLKMLHSGAPSKDRGEATKALVMLDLAVFKAEIETGMFKKLVDQLVKEYSLRPASRRSARRDNRFMEARGIAAGGGY